MDDYPLLELMLTMLWLYVVIAWFWFLIVLMSDAMRSSELSGPAKAGWVLALLFLPIISAVVYLAKHGDSMRDRRLWESRSRGEGQGAASTADELTKLAALRDAGTLTDEEFAAQKSRLLAT